MKCTSETDSTLVRYLRQELPFSQMEMIAQELDESELLYYRLYALEQTIYDLGMDLMIDDFELIMSKLEEVAKERHQCVLRIIGELRDEYEQVSDDIDELEMMITNSIISENQKKANKGLYWLVKKVKKYQGPISLPARKFKHQVVSKFKKESNQSRQSKVSSIKTNPHSLSTPKPNH